MLLRIPLFKLALTSMVQPAGSRDMQPASLTFLPLLQLSLLCCRPIALFCNCFVCLLVCLPEQCSQHECKHDDGQAEGEHEGKEDPVVGGGGVEDDEVDEDAGDEGGARDEQGVNEEPGQPKG